MEHAPLHHSISIAPDAGIAYWVSSEDGVRLRIGVWTPEQSSRGTVLFFPGRGDYIELYGHPITSLVEARYTPLVIEWRGHGLSGRIAENPKVGHVEHFSDYQKDVKAMIAAAQELDLPKPCYLIAHSMGACIGLRSLINGLDVQAAAFSSPMFQIRMAAYERLAARPLTWTMRALGRGHVYAPGFNDSSYVLRNAFAVNTLTNSSEDYQRWIMQGTNVPELHTGGPSMGWLYAALQETRDLSKCLSPDVPCISFYGDQDMTVNVAAIVDRMNQWPNGTIEQVSNAKHELFLEMPEVRNAVIARIFEFFSRNQSEPAAKTT